VPRQARLDVPGTLHHVIIRGIEKRRIFDDDEDRKRFVTRLEDIATDTETKIYAWSLMTNHAHILLRSGPLGLPKFMRRLLTGYAVTYNLRYNRHGHLFQNRYCSIVCDEEAYFQELVRYIHLNPLRAGLVKTILELDFYPWCGHSALMDRKKYSWQDCDYVLSRFGKREGEARRSYRRYVEEGVSLGRRPELVGGGLVRSSGGWSGVVSMRQTRGKILADQRILGSGDFVERILMDSAEQMWPWRTLLERGERVQKIIETICVRERISVEGLRMGGRRSGLSRVRSEVAEQLVIGLGIPLAEVARALGVSTSAISKLLTRRNQNSLWQKST